MLPIRVLLADDHPSLRAGIRARLEKESDIIVVGEAGTGAEALKLAEQVGPHVLLLDMQMPDLSGVEVARRLRESSSPVRVLVLSAHHDEQYVVKLLDCGVAGYLTKQEPLETIVSAVRGVAAGEEGWLSRDAAAALMKQRRTHSIQLDDPLGLLSDREQEVLRLVADGKNNHEIGGALFISESTVKKHVNNIYAKLEIRTRAEAAAWAWKHGLVSRDNL
jgi:DNA-binding NarL/FixJ family response regulator